MSIRAKSSANQKRGANKRRARPETNYQPSEARSRRFKEPVGYF